MSAKVVAPKCVWCRRGDPATSDYEQENLRTGIWSRLCRRCATKRLNNPFTGLFSNFRHAPRGQS